MNPLRSVTASLLALCLAAAAQDSPPAPRNVYSAGGQVRPDARVGGDFGAVGGRIVIDQAVAGDASVAGGAIDVRAPVGDDLRAAGADVSVDSTVGGELFATAANVTIGPAAVIGRGATLYGGTIAVEGRVDGTLKASGQTIRIDGEVRGNAELAGERIELGPKAIITGALRYTSERELVRAEGASVAGAVTREQPAARPRAPERERPRPAVYRSPGWAGSALAYVALLACAALLLLVLPKFAESAADRIRATPWSSLGLGFATLLAVPLLALLLFVTILGIPVGIAMLALYPALLLAGFLVSVLFIARLLPPALRRGYPAHLSGAMGYYALALLLVMLLAQVPFVGALVIGFTALAGLGGAVLEAYRRRPRAPGGGAAPEPVRQLP